MADSQLPSFREVEWLPGAGVLGWVSAGVPLAEEEGVLGAGEGEHRHSGTGVRRAEEQGRSKAGVRSKRWKVNMEQYREAERELVG